ncbi:MAG: adenine deaminase C-terminal domain-containing protein, partial [Phycisphaerae bacterium]
FPGVIAGDTECLDKIRAAGRLPIDGHAPGLSGKDLCAYAVTGVASDHECTTADEAREKLRQGFHIMIREGSVARNLDALLPVVRPDNVDRFMFVTDDKDVEDLHHEGHIDCMVRRAIAAGINPIHAIKMASYNAARYFGLDGFGAIAPGKVASIAVLKDLKDCRVTRVYHLGKLVALDGMAIDRDVGRRKGHILRSSMNVQWIECKNFEIKVSGRDAYDVHVIKVLEDRVDTERSIERIDAADGLLCADPKRDLAKITVLERHQSSGNIGLGFVRGFGLSSGAIASSVSHDAHNLVVAGTNDRDMYTAAVHLVKIRGGFCVVDDGKVLADVPLPIAGLMSNVDADTLKKQLGKLHEAAATLNVKLRRPFMALSFLCLSVIGKLKVTDQGLVDVDRFKLIGLVAVP